MLRCIRAGPAEFLLFGAELKRPCCLLLDPRHILATTDTDRAAFDPDGPGAELKKMPGVNIAVVDVIEFAGPSTWCLRHQPIENRHADERPATQRRIVIVSIGPGTTGFRIDRGLRRGDNRAQPRTAWSHLHMGAILRQPKAFGIGRRDSSAQERVRCHSGHGTKLEAFHGEHFMAGPVDALHGEFPLGLTSVHNMPGRSLAAVTGATVFHFGEADRAAPRLSGVHRCAPVPSDGQAHHLLCTHGINTLHTIEGRSDGVIEEPFVILDRGLPEPEDGVVPEAKPFSYEVAQV
jgi:hypothetical protein